MSRTVETQAARIVLIEPHEAGQHDPPMQDWLQLPVGDSCPNGHPHWGTDNPCGYFLVRRCKTCNTKFRGEVNTHTIQRVIEGLLGQPQRHIREVL